jgi:hypothetical protein
LLLKGVLSLFEGYSATESGRGRPSVAGQKLRYWMDGIINLDFGRA